jgi:hypothetical protein
MAQPDLLEQARQGDVLALKTLINLALRQKGIVAEVQMNQECLYVTFRCDRPLNQSILANFIRRGLLNLAVTSIRTAKLCAYQTDATLPGWVEELSISTPAPTPHSPLPLAHSALPTPRNLHSVPSGPTAYLVLFVILIASSTLSGSLFAAVRYSDSGKTRSSSGDRQTLLEQDPIAIEAEAKKYLTQMNQAQQAFYQQHQRFAATLEELERSAAILSHSAFYTYHLSVQNDRQSRLTAVAKVDGLRSYTGTVWLASPVDGAATVAIALCETRKPTRTAPATPRLVQQVLQCPANSQSVPK